MASALTDLRLALRMIRRRPVLSAAVVLPIAFAIAINSALFSVMDGLLFRPLPLQKPGDLVAIDYRRVGGELPELACAQGVLCRDPARRFRVTILMDP